VINLHGKKVDFDVEIKNPVSLYCIDSVLLLNNRNNAVFLDRYNLNTKKFMGSCIPFGSGPNELLIVKQLQRCNSSVWLFDQMQQKLYQYKLPGFYMDKKPKPSRCITLEEQAYSFSVVPSNDIIAMSFNMNDKRFSIYDMSGKLIGRIGNYPQFGEEMTKYEKIESFFGNMVLSCDNKNIIVAYQQTDLIEIYDTNGELKTRMHGPDHFFPTLKQKGSGDRIGVSPQYGKTRDAFVCPVCFQDEVWLLYSGKVYDPKVPQFYLDTCILVFNMKGEFIRKYNLDIPIFSFTIDSINHKIYALTEHPEIEVVEFRF